MEIMKRILTSMAKQIDKSNICVCWHEKKLHKGIGKCEFVIRYHPVDWMLCACPKFRGGILCKCKHNKSQHRDKNYSCVDCKCNGYKNLIRTSKRANNKPTRRKKSKT